MQLNAKRFVATMGLKPEKRISSSYMGPGILSSTFGITSNLYVQQFLTADYMDDLWKTILVET
jgi:hypothetical protein